MREWLWVPANDLWNMQISKRSLRSVGLILGTIKRQESNRSLGSVFPQSRKADDLKATEIDCIFKSNKVDDRSMYNTDEISILV